MRRALLALSAATAGGVAVLTGVSMARPSGPSLPLSSPSPTPALPLAQCTPLGRAVLVGAGPGAADLLTLRGAAALAAADVVVYDALIGEDVLQHCAPTCERVRMGKRGGDAASARQEDISQLLVRHCQAGRTVVRLKGGDPLLFGRAADELRALRAAG